MIENSSNELTKLEIKQEEFEEQSSEIVRLEEEQEILGSQLKELKEKDYTSYRLRKDKLIGESQIQKIRKGEIASKETLNTICKLLQCQPGDILEYVEDEQ